VRPIRNEKLGVRVDKLTTSLIVILSTLMLLTACLTSFGEVSPPPAGKTTNTPSLPLEQGRFFAASGTCAICHIKMVDEAGMDVSNTTYWRSTLMANASRDPYWQASVQREVLSSPDYQTVIEDKCAACHTPMARFTEATAGQQGEVLAEGFLNPDNKLHTLAMDGVSCTVCHQIRDAGLTQASSFSGGFVIKAEQPSGERELFGPYPIDKGQVAVMQGGSGYIPRQSKHVQQAALCATCHTLHTATIDEAGQVVGEFPEQTPYLEWLNSDYANDQSCQGCHMPHAQGGVQLSITGGEPRSPFSKHVFVGGNVYVPEILKTFGEQMGVTASDEQFEATIERTLTQLQERTATINIEQAHLSATHLTVEVIIKSQAGHKFPTGYPARRAWLHLVVEDASGQVVFESGQVNPDGSIKGNDNDTDPTRYEAHYQTIETADQVQIYEAMMQDPAGQVTTTLMRAAKYAKDNRLLPLGFDRDIASPDIAVQGEAAVDKDFVGGEDRIQYLIDVQGAQGPFAVTAELLYQSISYRWVENLRQYEAPEVTRFLDYHQSIPNQPVVVDSERQKSVTF